MINVKCIPFAFAFFAISYMFETCLGIVYDDIQTYFLFSQLCLVADTLAVMVVARGVFLHFVIGRLILQLLVTYWQLRYGYIPSKLNSWWAYGLVTTVMTHLIFRHPLHKIRINTGQWLLKMIRLHLWRR